MSDVQPKTNRTLTLGEADMREAVAMWLNSKSKVPLVVTTVKSASGHGSYSNTFEVVYGEHPSPAEEPTP